MRLSNNFSNFSNLPSLIILTGEVDIEEQFGGAVRNRLHAEQRDEQHEPGRRPQQRRWWPGRQFRRHRVLIKQFGGIL